MAKNLLQDMIVNKTGSEVDGYASSPKRKIWEEMKGEKREIPKEEPSPRFYQPQSYEDRDVGSGGNKYGLWIVALFAIVMLLFALSFLFAKATINLNPKTKPINLNSTFSAIKENNSESLTFDLVAISGEEIKSVEGGEEKEVTEKAKGTVVIYNNFSSSPQPLAIDTRLEGSNGKIYKTETKLTVPGMKNGTPGSVEVKVYASEPGEDYNSEPLDFKIFGFKGTPKYEKFYARSKGDISGGFTGRSYTVADSEKSKYLLELKDSLENKLLTKAREQIPDGFILFDDAVALSIEGESTDFISKDKNITISMKGTLYGLLLDEQKLTKEIAKSNVPGYDDSPVYIPNIQDLKFSILDKSSLSFKDTKAITFKLEGASNLVWSVDVQKLMSQVLGKKKKDFYNILAEYPNIDSADLIVKPIWKNSFPDEEKKINIIINEPT